jgi:hypothetical protein
MKRCSLPTSLRLRAPLPRPPWNPSRLPHHGRSLTVATRLAKDRDGEPTPEPTQVEEHGPTGLNLEQDRKHQPEKGTRKKDEAKGAADKSSKKKAKEGQDGSDGSKKAKESRDASRADQKSKERKEGSEGRKRAKGDKAGAEREKKGQAKREEDGTTKARLRRVRSVRSPPPGLPTGDVVERKIAQMRKELDEIHERNKRVLGDGPGRPPMQTLKGESSKAPEGKSLKEALLGAEGAREGGRPRQTKKQVLEDDFAKLDIKHLNPEELDFQPVDYEIPPVPRLAYGLDRVLFNPGVYRLQDPRSRVYNFDPYLEKIMSVNEFNFSALSEYKTSSKDEELLALTEKMGTKFTGSTSSMSGVLQHFHFLLSNFRPLNHEMLSQKFPKPTDKFSKITTGPSAIFLRWKDGIYAIDADKAYDQPNIMSWLGHSLEKLLTVDRKEFERYRRSSGDAVPGEDASSRCYHYSKLGNFLMRSQLDAYDPRLPGKGIFDLKTRAVVSIRMNHEQYESGKGYQIRYDHGEWESYEREFYDMTRATMLKYSLQVRMGRMDGIFVAYHNIERIFGFQYLPIEDMDNVLHGQKDTCLGDQEFKMSISLLDELMQKATEQYPEQVSASTA